MTFIEFLKANKEKKIYVDPCSGNNGDKLIWLGMQEALNNIPTKLVLGAKDADLIIVNGSGNFIDAYKQGIGKINSYSSLYPDIPLCVAPSSYYFNDVDFGIILDQRKSDLFLFSREEYSKEFIDKLAKTRTNIVSYLDHDLAFQLAGSDKVNSILKKYPSAIKGNLLIVDRMDIENSKTKGKNSFVKRIYITCVPEFMKSIIRSLRVAKQNKIGSELNISAKKILDNKHPGFKIIKVTSKDISRIDICDFDEFIRLISEAEYIFTNRLHVGVLGHLLGRNVYMEEGSYHKMTGIYELSMSKNNNVNLINN